MKKTASLVFAVMTAWTGTVVLLPQSSRCEEEESKAPERMIKYSIVDLGLLPHRWADDKAGLNETGAVAAWKTHANNWIQADLIKGGSQIELGSLAGFEDTFAADINNHGMIVGVAQSRNDIRYTRAFLWRDGKMEDLPTLGGKYAAACAINQEGDIAGKAQMPDNSTMHAALWSHGQVKDLGTLPKGHSSEAHAINEDDEIVGEAEASFNGHAHAFFWSDGRMQDLGLLPGGTLSSAQAINNKHQIVGYSDTPDNGVRPVLWLHGHMTDLGTLGDGDDPSYALDINDAGQIVGGSYLEEGQERAFLWEKNQLFNLNDLIPANSGWLLLAAYRINNQSEIIGRGFYNGTAHLFLLRPLKR